MAACPSCGRAVAAALPKCIYCGAALAEAPPPAPEESVAPDEARSLVVAHLEGGDPDAVARALGLLPFEAAQRVLRKGPQLLSILETTAARAEVEGLLAQGLRALAIEWAEIRQASRPLRIRGGRIAGSKLLLRGEEGKLEIEGPLFVIQGPITRARQPPQEWKRPNLAAPEMGYRFHLYPAGHSRPVEIDPGAFEFAQEPVSGSSLLELRGWLAVLGATVDDGFRQEPPALGITKDEEASAAVLSQTLLGGDRPRKGVPAILDNLAQFRFYSAWRGIAERRRR